MLKFSKHKKQLLSHLPASTGISKEIFNFNMRPQEMEKNVPPCQRVSKCISFFVDIFSGNKHNWVLHKKHINSCQTTIY